MNDDEKRDVDVEIPEPIVKVLKSIASSLAEALTEVKERLFALEIEVKTLGSRVDFLEERFSKNTLTVGAGSENKSSLADSEAVVKRDVTSSSTFSTKITTLSNNSPSLALKSLEATSDADAAATKGSSVRALNQKLPFSSRSETKTPTRATVSTSSTHKEDKKKEKEELLKALKLIDML